MTTSAAPPSSILGRPRFELDTALSPIQSQVDALETNFIEEATSPTTLAAMVAGGVAYRFGRIGTLALGEGHLAAAPLHLLSLGIGLGTEVSAFELTSRTLQGVSGSRPGNANLWAWSGQGGWAQGLSSSFITFGMLKSAGFLAREQNIVFQHAFQSSSMVLGHNVAGALGFGLRPEGSAEQLLSDHEPPRGCAVSSMTPGIDFGTSRPSRKVSMARALDTVND
jgi:hypothetical protein